MLQGIVAGALPNTLQFGSINELFYAVDKSNFIWVFDEETTFNPSFNWFKEWRDWMTIGSVHPEATGYYGEVRLFEQFDVVIHFDLSEPTDLIR